MVVNYKDSYKIGYNSIFTLDTEAMMNIGVIKLGENDKYENKEELERAVLLIQGSVTFKWEEKEIKVTRDSCFDENPICLHLPKGVAFEIIGNTDSELMYQAVPNEKAFEVKLYNKEDTVSDVFGKDVLANTSIRTVRTIIDDDIANYSNLVMGEVINHPGKWSSYPPHYHCQPEVYYYKFLPESGFGISLIGTEAGKVEDGSASLITPNVVHPQSAAPGYAMYYVWMIPHKPKRWLKDRTFETKHEWLNEKDAKIWTQK